jgi:hypothetical protein
MNPLIAAFPDRSRETVTFFYQDGEAERIVVKDLGKDSR